MSVQKVSVLVPPLRPVPRGALWVGDGVAWLADGAGRIRSAVAAGLTAIRARRAAARAARRTACERAELIALASRYEGSQPEFAKDLFAAANNDRGR